MSIQVKNHRLYNDGKAVDLVSSPYISAGLADPVRIVVMHFTYGGSAASSAEWFRSKQNPGSSAHAVIERDGSLIQCVTFDKVAWHAGKSEWNGIVGLNRHSFGIELANWGYLRSVGGAWQTYTDKRISEPFLAVHKGGNPDGSNSPIGWEPYPEAQVQAAAELVRALVAAYGINEIVGHDDISPTRKWDPGPAFDMVRFRALVFGGRKSDEGTALSVTVQAGLNLRAGPSTADQVLVILPFGARLKPIEARGHWLSVSVLDAQGAPTRTGWVHSGYVS